MRNHSLSARAGLSYFKAMIPKYRNGKETPSLHADSAERRCFNLFGTLSLNRDLERTLAARTGSVGDRQAPMIRAVGMLVWKIR